MKKTVLLLIAFLMCSFTFGQDFDYSRNIVQKLSSVEFKGRGYVDDGNKIAANYIRNEYKTLGLNTFVNNYTQNFKIDVNTFPSKMYLEIDGKELTPGEDFIIDPASNSLNGIFDIYTIKKEDLLNNDKLKFMLKSAIGNVLLIDNTEFNVEDKEKQKQADELIRFIKYSPQIRIAAVIEYTNDKLTWSISNFQASKTAFVVKKKLDLLTFKKAKVEVKAEFINYKTQNIVGYIDGTQKTDSFLVFTAHYDHLGKMGSNTFFPGANDNASGIAMLLNLAKHYKTHPHKYSTVFIALSAEEIGLVGAKYFVENPLLDLKKIKFLVNFDLAGTGDEGIKVVNGSVFQDKFDILSKINDENKYLKSVQIRGAACISDHCMFYEKGVPSFYIYTLGGTKAYHDIYDKYETLPFTKFIDYRNLMIEFIDQL